MTLQLSSVDKAPVSLPSWAALIEDLGTPAPRRIARVLGVSQRTVYRWQAAGRAPRMACMALYWLTRWGRSQVDAQAVNDARLAIAYADSLRRELIVAERQIRHLREIGAFGTANEPIMEVLRAGR